MKITKHFFLIVLSTLFLVSCGDKKKKKEVLAYEMKPVASKVVANISNDVVITANDNMKFDKRQIRVHSGQKVKLTFKHIGKMDKQIMGHNFVLLKKGVHLVTFGIEASKARKTEYIPAGTEDVIAYTKLLGGGETDVIEFEAPEKGTYEFLCSFPGHYAMMKGKFIVE